jgi:hypothetical protein
LITLPGRVSNEPTSLPFLIWLANSRKRLATGPGLLNDPVFWEVITMGNPKIAIVAYCLAAGFILAVALGSPSKTQTGAGMSALTPISDPKVR